MFGVTTKKYAFPWVIILKVVQIVFIILLSIFICNSLDSLATDGYVTELNWNGNYEKIKDSTKEKPKTDDSSSWVAILFVTPLFLRFIGNLFFLGRCSIQTKGDKRDKDIDGYSLILRFLGVDLPWVAYILIVIVLVYIPIKPLCAKLNFLGYSAFIIGVISVGSILTTVGFFFDTKISTGRMAKFGLLFFGLGSFIGTANLMGIALMVHDHKTRFSCKDNYCLAIVKNVPENYIQKMDSRLGVKLENENNGQTGAKRIGGKDESNQVDSKGNAEERALNFDESYSIFFQEKKSEVIYSKEKYQKILYAPYQEMVLKPEDYFKDDKVVKLNALALAKIVRKIHYHYSKGYQVSLYVEGRTDDKPISTNDANYSNNQHLSETRAKACVMRIRTLVANYCLNNRKKNDKHFIDFDPIVRDVTYGAGNDYHDLGKQKKEGQHYRKAEIKIVPGRMLTKNAIDDSLNKQGFPLLTEQIKFLDYFYFSMYTITTTGYGDMAPVSPWSKFITVFLNIYELIYIVIFFNVLLSLTKQAPSPEFKEIKDETDKRINRLLDKIDRLARYRRVAGRQQHRRSPDETVSISQEGEESVTVKQHE